MDESVILHAERSFLVCRKPVGVECEHELPALLAEEMKCKVDSLYCVHRLDRAVGGVMVWARTPKAAAELSRQVQEKALKKAYFAVCSGIPTPDTGEMRDLLFKDSVKQKSFAVSSSRRGVKEALLDYRVLQTDVLNDSPVALVRVTLRTGRFHQIRCQFATRGHPLLGDGKYGVNRDDKKRGYKFQALYAYRLMFRFKPGEATALDYLDKKSFEASKEKIWFLKEFN